MRDRDANRSLKSFFVAAMEEELVAPI